MFMEVRPQDQSGQLCRFGTFTATGGLTKNLETSRKPPFFVVYNRLPGLNDHIL